MKLRKSTWGALISLGITFVVFIAFTTTTLPHEKSIPTTTSQVIVESKYKNEDDVVTLEELYTDRTDSPVNNPSLHVNSTADLQPPFTTIDKVLDSKRKLINGTPAVVQGEYFTIEFHGNDSSGIKRFECNENSAGYEQCMSPILIYTKTDKSNGTKAIEIRAIDIYNNIEQQAASLLYETK